jgi:hypothetical protein
MRSQVRFFMLAEDEKRFVQAILEEPHTVLVNGPQWDTADVPLLGAASLPSSAWYLLIWNRAEVPRLRVMRRDDCWEVSNEHTTIQFLRCQLWNKRILCAGRISVAPVGRALRLERRYKRLRKVIQNTCRNGVICWVDPRHPTSDKNPSEPDRQVWVGSRALEWLRQGRGHKFKLDRYSFVEAILCAESVARPPRGG